MGPPEPKAPADGGTATPPGDELLRAYLTDRNQPCPVCGYDLRGLASSACPECGARLELRVGSIDLKLAPWLLGVLAVALPLGFTGVLAVVAAIGARRSAYWTSGDWIILIGLWGLTIAYGLILVILSKRRPRFLRRSGTAQWRRAWLMVAVMAVIQAGMIWLMVRYS